MKPRTHTHAHTHTHTHGFFTSGLPPAHTARHTHAHTHTHARTREWLDRTTAPLSVGEISNIMLSEREGLPVEHRHLGGAEDVDVDVLSLKPDGRYLGHGRPAHGNVPNVLPPPAGRRTARAFSRQPAAPPRRLGQSSPRGRGGGGGRPKLSARGGERTAGGPTNL